MKKMRKAAAMLMAATVAVAMPMTAMAASIEITNAKKDEVYKAYKIFDYNNAGNSYAYTIAADSEWKTAVEAFNVNGKPFFTLTPSVNDADTLVVTTPQNSDGSFVQMSEVDATAFAEHLAKYLNGKTALPDENGVTPDSDNKVSFGDLTPGYYFVDTTTGAVCSLFNSDSTQKLTEKNDFPEAVKKIISGTDSDGNDILVDSITATIDEKIQYKITITDKAGTDNEITVHDEMDDGLTWDGTIKVTDKNGDEVDSSNYTLETIGLKDKCKFEIKLNKKYVEDLGANDTVDIVYGATLNKNAVIGSDGNKNSAYIDYSKQVKTPAGTVTVYTYKFDLLKTDKDNIKLDNAKFELYKNYDAVTKTFSNKIDVVVDGDFYRVAQSDETVADCILVGEKAIKGLGNGTYYLKEIEAPQGYNALTDPVKVEIRDKDGNAVYNEKTGVWEYKVVQVINYTGTLLPSTGGIGTTVFYAAGIVVMAGAVFFVVRSRKHD